MALDPYAPCPCGNGQKIKFCCSADITHELDKILRAIEGDQRAAALDQLNRALAARPDNSALLAIKGSVLLSMSNFEEAQKNIDHFLAVDPKNPTALAQGAAVSALRGNTRQAVERLQAALEESNGTLNQQVHNVIHIVSDVLLAGGDVLGAYGHAMLYSSTAPREDEEAANAIARIRLSPQLPLLLRQERFLEPAPEGVAWKPKFDDAMALAAKACWLRACEQFISLAERVPNEPRIIRNIAVLRGYLGDTSGATLWWRKYASLEQVPTEDRIEAEALAQMLDANLPRATIDVVQTTFIVNDLDRAMERLLADKRLVAENRDAYLQQMEENEVPPKAVFTLLDRPLPTTGVGLELNDMSQSIADTLVYGRQTDREPRIEMTTERTAALDKAKETLTQVLGDTVASTSEEVLGQAPEEAVTLRVSLYPPRDTPREHYLQMIEQAKARVITETWPQAKNRFLDGHTPASVTNNPAYRTRLLATIFQMEEQNGGKSTFDFNHLRSQLGLPTVDKIDPAGVDLLKLPVWRFGRLEIEKLSDEQLLTAFQRAVFYMAADSIEPLGEALLARPSTHGTIDPHELYELLVRFASRPERAAHYAVLAQAMEKQHGHSPARFMLMELQARLMMGDGPTAKRLIDTISTVYRNEPGVNQALMQMLVQMGIISPDGRMRAGGGGAPGGAAMLGAEPAPAAAASGLWTPGAPAAPAAEKKSGLWLPD
jgi:tetratricopeptide (TPR) repeat protein